MCNFYTCNQTSVSKPLDLVCVLTKIADKSNQNEVRDIVCGCDYPEILTGHREAFLDSRDVLRQVTGCKRLEKSVPSNYGIEYAINFDGLFVTLVEKTKNGKPP